MENQNKKSIRAFAEAWASACSDSISKMLGSDWHLQVVNIDPPPARAGEPIQYRLTMEGSLRGQCFFEFYEPQASELISSLNGPEAEANDDQQIKPLTRAVTAATAALAQSLEAQFGKFTFRVEPVSGLAFGGMYVVPLASTADPTEISSLLYLDGQLIETLSAEGKDKLPASTENSPLPASNLKLLMDVELNVSLRFGQRQLPLREVLELGSGSVVELDRLVDEPVELLLDGKLVARGEAVIVDGNYGLRVTEIPQAVENHLLH